MKFKLKSVVSGDRPYWVKWSRFLLIMRPQDRSELNAEEISPYLNGRWFHQSANGDVRFIPATFYIEDGQAFFVNGRHRSLLLSRYANEIPMAITQVEPQSEIVLEQIAPRRIAPNEEVELPDLPISGRFRS